MSAELSRLNTQVRQLAEHQPFRVHWQISRVGAGDQQCTSIGQGEHTQLASFSTRKVSLLLACLALVHRGELTLGRRLTITETLKDGVQAGIMKNLAPGAELSLEDHLRQMMITSDNICTQLVFEAIDQVTGDALQWVNNYCAWVGLHSTVHREIFPRSGDLTWHHSIEGMTVTSPADQARLLSLLGAATADDGVAEYLHLNRELCQLAVEMMTHLFTPLMGAGTATLRFAEKNGRGLRSLSQTGLALTADHTPVAAVAVFAEHIPTELPTGLPGRLAAYDLFSSIGHAVEQWHMTDRSSGRTASPGKQPAPLPQVSFASATVEAGTTTPQQAHTPTAAHPLDGVGKLFAALAVAECAVEHPQLLAEPATIGQQHRHDAAAGPLRTHTGDITMSLADAMGLVVATSDVAASLAVQHALKERGLSLVHEANRLLTRLSHTSSALSHTVITGEEDLEHATGDLLQGQSSPQDLVNVLQLLAQAGGLTGSAAASSPEPADEQVRGISGQAADRVLRWMTQVFEPTGLAYGLPGYGPKKVPQWSVAGPQLRSPSSVHGCTSVLITHPPRGGAAATGLAVIAAHLPRDPRAEPTRGIQSAHAFGALGLNAYRSCGKIGGN